MAATWLVWPATARPTLAALMVPREVSTPDSPAGRIADDARHFAVLEDVDAAAVRAPRKAPGDRIMTGVAGAALKQAAIDRVAGVVRIDHRHHFQGLIAFQKLGIGAVQDHGIAAPARRVPFRRRNASD